MYITHNNQTYANVRVYSTSGSVRFTGDSLSGVTELTGPVTVYADNDFELRVYTPGNFLRQEITDGSWLLTNIPLPEPQPVVVTPAEYDLTVSTANAVRLLMAGKQPTTADEIIMCSALYPEWEAGVHKTDEIFLLDGDPWKVLAAYDNATHPDIAPGETAWATFNIPYHGTTRQTAHGSSPTTRQTFTRSASGACLAASITSVSAARISARRNIRLTGKNRNNSRPRARKENTWTPRPSSLPSSAPCSARPR